MCKYEFHPVSASAAMKLIFLHNMRALCSQVCIKNVGEYAKCIGYLLDMARKTIKLKLGISQSRRLVRCQDVLCTYETSQCERTFMDQYCSKVAIIF